VEDIKPPGDGGADRQLMTEALEKRSVLRAKQYTERFWWGHAVRTEKEKQNTPLNNSECGVGFQTARNFSQKKKQPPRLFSKQKGGKTGYPAPKERVGGDKPPRGPNPGQERDKGELLSHGRRPNAV